MAVSFDNVANDGESFLRSGNERDNVTEVENARGGVGDDDLVGNALQNSLTGGGGDDRLRGGSNADVLDGGLGSDRFEGESGNDVLLARDAEDDQVRDVLSCGTGTDSLQADVRDDDTRALPTDCETASQGMVRELPNVRILSARSAAGGSLDVRLRCPRGTRNGCAGTLAAGPARGRGRFGAETRYRVARGRSKTVRIRAAARRGARVRLRSEEKGRLGPRTTLRTLTVR